VAEYVASDVIHLRQRGSGARWMGEGRGAGQARRPRRRRC
jgi:hypothetical protein